MVIDRHQVWLGEAPERGAGPGSARERARIKSLRDAERGASVAVANRVVSLPEYV